MKKSSLKTKTPLRAKTTLRRNTPLTAKTTLRTKINLKADTTLKSKKKLRRKSKSAQRKIEDEIWKLCREVTKKKYGNTCYTCGATGLEKQNWQCGHMWPKATLGAYLKYDLRVLRPQCFRCNIHHGGAGAIFYVKVLEEIGVTEMERLVEDKKVAVKAMDFYPLHLERLSALAVQK